MAGVRVQHPTERNVTYVIVDPKRKYSAPVVCPLCMTTHTFKTYHLRLDETGAGIVSEEIVDKLKRIRGHGIQYVNEVVKPPAQSIGLNANPDQARIVLAKK
jgi:hypothetical protein